MWSFFYIRFRGNWWRCCLTVLIALQSMLVCSVCIAPLSMWDFVRLLRAVYWPDLCSAPLIAICCGYCYCSVMEIIYLVVHAWRLVTHYTVSPCTLVYSCTDVCGLVHLYIIMHWSCTVFVHWCTRALMYICTDV